MSDIDPTKFIVFGRSLGGAVATGLASTQKSNRPQIFALILENTFTSLPDIANYILVFTSVFPESSFNSIYPSLERIKSITTPTLFISGTSDKIVPPTMMDELFEASASSCKRLLVQTGGTHDYTWRTGGYFKKFKQFLDDAESGICA